MIKVLFYSDARELGGHEFMTASAIRFMAQQPGLDISVAYCDKNRRLHDKLSKIKDGCKLTLYPLRLKSEGLPVVRSLFYMSRLLLVERLIESVAPNAVVVSQGNIEVSSLGLVAAKRARCRTISYLPMAPKLTSLSRPISIGHDIIDRCLYRLPDKIITISHGVRRTLRERGVQCEIAVVNNGIELASGESRSTNRVAYGFLENEYVVAVVGRIAFRQKAQDFLMKSIAQYRDKLRGTHFCVIGEGPDEPKLKSMIREEKLDDCVSVLAWKNNLVSLYSAADMLVIPSHFEGVPLVMLEAMWHRLPIVASDVDGMAELLPREWLFREGDAKSLVNTVSRVRHADNQRCLAANQQRVLREFSMPLFQERFCDEVLGSSGSVRGSREADTNVETAAL